MEKIRFMYNGKQYQTGNLEKQLKKLGITENDIVICKKDENEEMNNVKLYYFYNPNNGHTITSMYPDLEHLRNCKEYNINEWILKK